MAAKHWVLTDLSPHDGELFSITPFDFLPEENVVGGWSVTKRRLRGGRGDGVEMVCIDNGRLRFIVLPTRGMGLWKAWCGDLEVGWKSPANGPVHPALVPLSDPSGIGWLRGFDELVARCGLESNGAPQFTPSGVLKYPLHGRIQNTPAHHVELTVDPERGEISLCGVVDETALFGNSLRLRSTYTTSFGDSTLRITDMVENISGSPKDFELLYHTNFGVPILTPGAKVVLPVKRMAPRDANAAGRDRYDVWDTYEQPTPGIPEVCYYCDLYADSQGVSGALFHDPDANRGVWQKFSRDQFPCFTLWKNPLPETDGYVTGFEPGTNYPNTHDFEKSHGRVVTLAAGQSRIFEMELSLLTDADAVTQARESLRDIVAGRPSLFLEQPDPQWCE